MSLDDVVNIEDLHVLVQATSGQHPGILVVRADNDPSRDMKDRDVARAIANLERAGVPIESEMVATSSLAEKETMRSRVGTVKVGR